jgi:hypothetical protein
MWSAITLAEKEGRLGRSTFPLPQPIRMHWAPDLHFPFHNKDVVTHIIDVSRGCDIIGQIGDLLEAYGVSSHKKNPAIKHTLEDEARMARNEFWIPIRNLNPEARLIQVTGNHEERIVRYNWENAPAYYDNPNIGFATLIKAEKYGIEMYDRTGLKLHGMRFKHGDVARAQGSARAEMTRHRYSGVSGHTHRCEWETIIDAEGVRTDWWSIGHACRPELLDYLRGKPLPNWQLSAGITFTIYPDGTIDTKEHRLS